MTTLGVGYSSNYRVEFVAVLVILNGPDGVGIDVYPLTIRGLGRIG